MARAAQPVKERIRSKIKQLNGCWEWQGRITRQGYGQMSTGSRTDKTRSNRQAHIVSYESFIGEVPEGLVLDHLCRNRACVNPGHLEPVSLQENIRRGELGKIESAKTHCPQGHEYSEENTIVSKRTGKLKEFIFYRRCRTCTNDRNLAAYYKRKLNTGRVG